MKMSSREALSYIIENAIDDLDIIFDDEIQSALKIIVNDLEILEILKRNLYVEKGTGKFKGIEVIQCSLGNQHSEEFNKVKEWLEDGK